MCHLGSPIYPESSLLHPPDTPFHQEKADKVPAVKADSSYHHQAVERGEGIKEDLQEEVFSCCDLKSKFLPCRNGKGGCFRQQEEQKCQRI